MEGGGRGFQRRTKGRTVGKTGSRTMMSVLHQSTTAALAACVPPDMTSLLWRLQKDQTRRRTVGGGRRWPGVAADMTAISHKHREMGVGVNAGNHQRRGDGRGVAWRQAAIRRQARRQQLGDRDGVWRGWGWGGGRRPAVGAGRDPSRHFQAHHHGGGGYQSEEVRESRGGSSPTAGGPTESTQTAVLKPTPQGVDLPTDRGTQGGGSDAKIFHQRDRKQDRDRQSQGRGIGRPGHK